MVEENLVESPHMNSRKTDTVIHEIVPPYISDDNTEADKKAAKEDAAMDA